MSCEKEEYIIVTPPMFSNLCQKTKVLLTDHYYYNVLGMGYKANGDITIEATGDRCLSNLKTDCMFLGTFIVAGCNVSESWTTNNVFTTTISAQNLIKDGLTFYADYTFAPFTGRRTSSATMSYKMPTWNMTLDYKNEDSCLDAAISGIATYKNWFGGAMLTLNLTNAHLKEVSVAFGYYTNEFFLHTKVANCEEFSGSLYHQVNANLESGVQLSWSSLSNRAYFGLGCIYNYDVNTLLAAKIDDNSQIGLSFCQKIHRCLTLTTSAFVDCRHVGEGGHKVGLGLEYEG